MKNYYEILEVDKKASQDVIEKAYKTLVKKYHPDLQGKENQTQYEKKMKEINEAYEILSNDYRRSIYDQQLETSTITKEEYERIRQENSALKQQMQENEILHEQMRQRATLHQRMQQEKISQNINREQEPMEVGDTVNNMIKVFGQQINAARNQAYRDAYIQDMKNRGYKIKYKHSFQYYVKLVIYIAIIILICALIYQIPVVKSFFTNLYNENVFVKVIVDIVRKTFSTDF